MSKINKQVLGGVQTSILKLWDKIKDIDSERYLCFDITFSFESGLAHKGKTRAYYNIYTPTLNHNRFNNKKELFEFIDKMCEADFEVLNKQGTKYKITKLEEEIEESKKEIERLKNKLIGE